jgi:hypothetical protein
MNRPIMRWFISGKKEGPLNRIKSLTFSARGPEIKFNRIVPEKF